MNRRGAENTENGGVRLLLFSVLSVSLWFNSSSFAVDPPIVGRPADFSGAIGGPFAVTAGIEPNEVTVEQPFVLTLRIMGPGNLRTMPRPSLGKLPAFQPFAVDDLDDEFKEGSPPGRVFRYRLRPRTAEIREVPAIRFVYFNPAIVPASRGYQTTYTEPAPIRVNPEFRPSSKVPPVVPDWMLVPATRDEICGSDGGSLIRAVRNVLHATTGPGGFVDFKMYANALFFEAVDEFKSGKASVTKFAEAARRLAVVSFSDEAARYRTLGHAYFLAGDTPSSIAAYARGVELDPSDGRLRAAIEFARGEVLYPSVDMHPAIPVWPYWLSLRRLWWIAVLNICFATVALFGWNRTRSQAWLIVCTMCLLVAVLPFIGFVFERVQRARNEDTPMVVLAHATELRRGNGEAYPPRLDATLPAGVEVRRLFERHGWLQVELANGVVGWVPMDSIVR